ncbi:MAG: putative ABC transporter permease [Massilimicrobiota timonensis]
MERFIYDQLGIFFVYSFIGWLVGTVLAAYRRHRFIDVGFLYGPYCPSYGICGVLFAVLLYDLKGQWFFLFLGGAIIVFMVVYLTGFLLQQIFHHKWWDCSHKKFQFGSYVHMPYTILWGLMAVISIEFIEPLLLGVLHWIPMSIREIILIILLIIMGIDLLGTLTGILSTRSRVKKGIVKDVSENMQKTADRLGMKISEWTLKHFVSAYPHLDKKEILNTPRPKKNVIFAKGCSFYKLVWLFFIGAFLGDIVETIFCYMTTGTLMSRSSVVYGPFSIVWGIGCAVLTLLLYQYRDRSDRFIFMFGTLVGGAYEYACSVFTEIVFGTVFWDYSHLPFNLGGRINLLFCFFWGIVAVVWIKMIYPVLSSWIEKITYKKGVIMTWCFVVFMTFNILMSGLALSRYSQRQNGLKAQNSVERYIDQQFPDQRMEMIYPNAKFPVKR